MAKITLDTRIAPIITNKKEKFANAIKKGKIIFFAKEGIRNSPFFYYVNKKLRKY